MHYNAGGFDLLTYMKNPEVFNVNEGSVELLTAPGLGIEMNEELIRKEAEESKDFSWRNPTCESSDLRGGQTDVSGRGPDGGIREW